MPVKSGNMVKSKLTGHSAMVLAVRKDGTRAKVYIYGPDAEKWVPVTAFDIEVSGIETCWKCQGSGLYYSGGMVLNGVYTGKTGPCYGCQGKGKQDDADRLRCHFYWHRHSTTDENPAEERERKQVVAEAREVVEPEPAPVPMKFRSKREREAHLSQQLTVDLTDNCQCGTMHRLDVPCPW